MDFSPTSIPDVIVIRPRVFGDDRGFFMETFQARSFRTAGISADFVQDNHSRSRRGVLRGLHYQVCRPQGKLVRVVDGEIFDVAVDLRKSSATFGRWVGETISSENKKMTWIPPGFAHGFLVLSSEADVLYKATDYYAPECERTLAWNDAIVAIRWPIPPGALPILSPKDAAGVPLGQAELFN